MICQNQIEETCYPHFTSIQNGRLTIFRGNPDTEKFKMT